MLLRKENKRQEKLLEMKIVLLERNSAGTDVPVDCFNELGEVTSYPNTVTAQEVQSVWAMRMSLSATRLP